MQMKILVAASVLVVFVAAGQALAQVPPQDKIDKAIDTGCEFLLKQSNGYLKDYGWVGTNQSDAVLVLYTLVKGKAKRNHPGFAKTLAFCLNHRIENTYFAAVLALALEDLDPKKYFGKLGQCASFLVANQCKNGQWDYGKPVRLPSAGSSLGGMFPGSRKTVSKTPVVFQKGGERAHGDNSNTQYALLALRSCEVAGYEVPKDTWARALGWWKKTQRGDGGWNYGKSKGEGSYLGMTEGGLGSVVLCLHYLQQDWRNDASVKKAKDFIGSKFHLEKNYVPREKKDSWQYYHLYALERAGSLSYTERFGSHEWYAEGAKFLLAKQKPDGKWDAKSGNKRTVWDTCFAVLFLARATRPVASEHRR
jgi:hypothetical protein